MKTNPGLRSWLDIKYRITLSFVCVVNNPYLRLSIASITKLHTKLLSIHIYTWFHFPGSINWFRFLISALSIVGTPPFLFFCPSGRALMLSNDGCWPGLCIMIKLNTLVVLHCKVTSIIMTVFSTTHRLGLFKACRHQC